MDFGSLCSGSIATEIQVAKELDANVIFVAPNFIDDSVLLGLLLHGSGNCLDSSGGGSGFFGLFYLVVVGLDELLHRRSDSGGSRSGGSSG